MKLVANYLAKLETELDCAMFRASVANVLSACDRIVIVAAPGHADNLGKITDITSKFQYVQSNITIIPTGAITDFSQVRNLALDCVAEGEFFYWIDADEVGFKDAFFALRQQMERFPQDNLTKVRTRFVHFCLHPGWYERMESRTTIMRKGPNTHWEGAVHERVVNVPAGATLHSDYTLHHYGYCKPQDTVFNHWQHYATLEGDPNRYINEEVDGVCVPYFRDGDRPSPANILDDRKKVLIPYFGRYPDMKLYDLLLETCPAI